MQTDTPSTDDKSVLENVKRLLEGLRRTVEGEILYSLIDRALQRYGGRQGRIEQAFVTFLGRLLDNYINKSASDPVTRIKARVLRQRLAPYLQAASFEAAQVPTAAVAVQSSEAPAAAKADAPTPPLLEPQTQEIPAAAIALDAAPAQDEPGDFDILHIRLARNVAETLARNREFDSLLRSSISNIKQADGNVDDLKKLLVDGLEDLVQNQQTLDTNLQTTTRFLNAMHVDRRRLVNALDKAQRYSLTDELTGLPNRTAFLRQLESEVGRARRYGFSLALALLDLDQLGSINDGHGRDAGDAVLQFFSREVMSQFRSYDTVARYGNDEFAVLFPNTQREGAARALEKAQKRAHDACLNHMGKRLPLPSFSSVLTLYVPGEKPAALLQRADEALGQAKAKGPGQSIVALSMG